jgi:hypothetical protein
MSTGPKSLQDASQPLPSIGKDIWLAVLDYLVPGSSFTKAEARDMLDALSRSCRFLAGVCIPRLFRTIHLYPPRNPDTILWDRSSSDLPRYEWTRRVQMGDPAALRLAAHVETFHIYPWTEGGDSEATLISAFSTLTRLPRLVCLILHRIRVPRRAIETIASINTLDSLHLMGCCFAPEDVQLMRSSIRELVVFPSDDRNEREDEIYVLEDVVEQLADPQRLRVFRWNGYNVTSKVLQSGVPFAALEVFELVLDTLNAGLQQLLIRFLESTPTLRDVSITDHKWGPSDGTVTLTTSALPHLSRLSIPPQMLRPLGVGRSFPYLKLIESTRLPDARILHILGSSFPWAAMIAHVQELETFVQWLVPGGALTQTRQLHTLKVSLGQFMTVTKVRFIPFFTAGARNSR